MRFIFDAHLPKKVTEVFANLGHDAIHTRDLPDGNESSDEDIILVAADDRILVSKDHDFYQSFLLHGKPPKLILVKVGNMRLREVTDLFKKVAEKLVDLLTY